MTQAVSLSPGTAPASASTAVPLSLSASATVPAAKLLPALALVALYAAQVCAPASAAASPIATSASANP